MSPTNGPRSLSRVKVGTHSPSPTRSHTTAHTPKHGPSLPQPQCGLMPPAKFFLFHRAFIYIHFPVLYEPSTPAEEKNPAKLPPQRCSKPLFIAFFNFSHKRPMFAFTDESEYTRLSEKDRTQGHTRRNRGVSDGGAITTLRPFCVVRKPCVAGT